MQFLAVLNTCSYVMKARGEIFYVHYRLACLFVFKAKKIFRFDELAQNVEGFGRRVVSSVVGLTCIYKMCKGKVLYDEQKDKMDKKVKTTSNSNGATKADHSEETKHDGSHSQRVRRRRQKREKKGVEFVDYIVKKKQSKLKAKHGEKSGGVEALLPSLGVLGVLGFGLMARMGFRGRISVAGIDLGTTNSVICIQAQTSGGKNTMFSEGFSNSFMLISFL